MNIFRVPSTCGPKLAADAGKAWYSAPIKKVGPTSRLRRENLVTNLQYLKTIGTPEAIIAGDSELFLFLISWFVSQETVNPALIRPYEQLQNCSVIDTRSAPFLKLYLFLALSTPMLVDPSKLIPTTHFPAGEGCSRFHGAKSWLMQM